jgi:hypothetical protein
LARRGDRLSSCCGIEGLSGVEFGVDGGGGALVFPHHPVHHRGEEGQPGQITTYPQHPSADDLV